MRPHRTESVVLALVLLIAVFVPNPSEARAQEAATGEICPLESFGQDSTVDVLLLLDQSGSLKEHDPDADRVFGANEVVHAFASLSESVKEVRILVAGFGTYFVPDKWTPLNPETSADVLREIARFHDRDEDRHTDYTEAMHGVVEAFSTSQASCKLLYWFTDGKHDLDDRDPELGKGFERSYLSDDLPLVTSANRGEVEALMPELICGDGGYADQLGEQEVRVEVLLLGSGRNVDPPSRQVLEGMGGVRGHECGPSNGRFARVDRASDIPYEWACRVQAGTYRVHPPPSIENGVLTVTETDILTVIDKDIGVEIPNALITSLRIFTSGLGAPPKLTVPPLTEFKSEAVGTGLRRVSAPLTGQKFILELSGVEKACLFVTADAPTLEVIPETTLYQGEPGEFSVRVLGPHGDLTGTALREVNVEATYGEEQTRGDVKLNEDETGYVISVGRMPESETFRLQVIVTVGPLSSTAKPEPFPVKRPPDAPRVIDAPEPIEGEGTGPFVSALIVNGGDGGELCLEESQSVMMDDADGSPLNVTATLNGQRCVDVPPGENQRVDLAISTSRQANADDVLEFRTTATSRPRPDQLVPGIVEVDLKVLPLVNTAVLRVIVATILLMLIGLLWAVLYGVNRLVARIPDVRRNRVRFGEFTARLTSDGLGRINAELVETPEDAQLRVPRATASQLKAGRLTLRRRVPIRPWVAPGAEMTLGTDVVAARIGSGASQAVVLGDKRLRTRSRVALGPLVAIGVAKGQLERVNETAQSVHGVVLFDTRSARGQDAGEVVAELIRTGLAEIGVRLATTEAPQGEGTTRR